MDAMELNSRYRPEMTPEGVAELCQQILVSSGQVSLTIYCAKKSGLVERTLSLKDLIKSILFGEHHGNK